MNAKECLKENSTLIPISLQPHYTSGSWKTAGALEGAESFDFNRPASYTPKFLAEKILTSRGRIEGERKIITVMFANIANSPAVFADLDAETVYGIMDGCFRLLLDEVHRYEGIINEFLGNGVMALFGAPLLTKITLNAPAALL